MTTWPKRSSTVTCTVETPSGNCDPSGGSSGSGNGDGGAAGKLPFTGFAAGAVAALGAGLASAGAAARKYLARG